ncbi:MAG: hypothetical protein IJT98_03880 [Prevotella sp.]|nr:hypothetical protein [Prevotella sp.]
MGYPVQPGMAFNLVHRSFSSVKAYAFLLGGQQLAPDSLHRADSLTIINKTKEFNVTERLKMYYSQADNRHQSVDANQIVFGAEQCDPYQLLSLFRYTRSTSIVSKIEHLGDQTYDVTVKLNADNSVAEMTVRQTQYWLGAPPTVTDITYTFEY